MTFTIQAEYLAAVGVGLFLVLAMLQIVGAVSVRQFFDEKNKPLAIYWELFLWVSFISTGLGAAICSGLLIALP